jgi:alpha-glucuronidase
MGSREACVNYMGPLGLGHIMARDHHYGPQPDDTVPGHLDWSPTYFHKADSAGLGYDRSRSGSGFVEQYFPPVAERFGDIDSCPESLLCWFHHVPWDRRMASGRTFWDELCRGFGLGVEYVAEMREKWESLYGFVDEGRFLHVKERLAAQEADAKIWRDTCVRYFQGFSGRDIP